jgi:hypothetical protein
VLELGPAAQPAQEAAGKLGGELRAAKTGKQQVVALRSFADSVGDSIRRIDALAPPPAMVPWHEDQRAKLAKSQHDAVALADAIERRDAPAVDEALKAFTTPAADTVPRKAQAAAIRGFNDKLRQQERLLARIAREQLALGSV